MGAGHRMIRFIGGNTVAITRALSPQAANDSTAQLLAIANASNGNPAYGTSVEFSPTLVVARHLTEPTPRPDRPGFTDRSASIARVATAPVRAVMTTPADGTSSRWAAACVGEQGAPAANRLYADHARRENRRAALVSPTRCHASARWCDGEPDCHDPDAFVARRISEGGEMVKI